MNICLPNVTFHWLLGLPSPAAPHAFYFILDAPNIKTYITDESGVPYLIGGSGSGDITLTSSDGSIFINGYDLTLSQGIIDTIITLHNSFPDLQGGDVSLSEFFHLKMAEHTYLTDVVANDSIGQILDYINLLATPPTYVAPTSSITNVSNTYEVGSTVGIDIIQTFIQNNAGEKTSETITKNGSVVSNTNVFTESLTITAGNTVYSGNVNYEEGDCLPNNIGAEDCTDRIPAGTTTSPQRTVIGALRRYAGSVATLPTTGASLRVTLLGTSVINTANNFTFTTGTTNRRFVIAVPSAKTLVSVQNTGTNEFITFTLNNTITSVPDAAGTNQPYKYYTLENAVPFSTNYTLNVILS